MHEYNSRRGWVIQEQIARAPYKGTDNSLGPIHKPIRNVYKSLSYSYYRIIASAVDTCRNIPQQTSGVSKYT